MKKTVIALENVSKIYRLGEEDLFALNKVNLEIGEGEFIAITGPSGSGKSTLMHVASILDLPSEGSVFVKGEKASDLSEEERASLRNKEIGFVFQQFNLLARTSAVENVALPLIYSGTGLVEREARAKKVLEKVGLGDKLKNTPAQLSGGQQQRVAIARALVNNPSVIFADEPTGNLDSKSGDEIKKILSNLYKEKRTVVMVTHERRLANIASRVITMVDGKITSDKRGNNEI